MTSNSKYPTLCNTCETSNAAARERAKQLEIEFASVALNGSLPKRAKRSLHALIKPLHVPQAADTPLKECDNSQEVLLSNSSRPVPNKRPSIEVVVSPKKSPLCDMCNGVLSGVSSQRCASCTALFTLHSHRLLPPKPAAELPQTNTIHIVSSDSEPEDVVQCTTARAASPGHARPPSSTSLEAPPDITQHSLFRELQAQLQALQGGRYVDAAATLALLDQLMKRVNAPKQSDQAPAWTPDHARVRFLQFVMP